MEPFNRFYFFVYYSIYKIAQETSSRRKLSTKGDEHNETFLCDHYQVSGLLGPFICRIGSIFRHVFWGSLFFIRCKLLDEDLREAGKE